MAASSADSLVAWWVALTETTMVEQMVERWVESWALQLAGLKVDWLAVKMVALSVARSAEQMVD